MATLSNKIKKRVQEYIEKVNTLYSIDKVFLFGSYAKGTPDKHSDIDIALFLKDANDRNRLKIMSEIIKLISEFKIDIQPIVFSSQDYFDEDNDFILNEIKRKGIEIHSTAKPLPPTHNLDEPKPNRVYS